MRFLSISIEMQYLLRKEFHVGVLMLGWEFPPFITGGLGTACYGLARAMEQLQVELLFLLPASTGGAVPKDAALSHQASSSGPVWKPRHVTLQTVPAHVPNPYTSSGKALANPGKTAYRPLIRLLGTGAQGGYDGNLIERIHEYGQRCAELVQSETFDVIHAHDWVTFPAGMLIAARSGKPLIVHVHATEFDRSGNAGNPLVREIEAQGLQKADAVIAVSQRTRQIIIEQYQVPPDKVHVVHNGVIPQALLTDRPRLGNGQGLVLFLGRLTQQKGPDRFLQAAAKVLNQMKQVTFIIAGWGDMGPDMIEWVAGQGLGLNIRFAGFLAGAQVQRAYRAADVYVMPSVSEPFGLTALEAVQQETPVIISKTSGVAEVLRKGALHVDFWDVDEMAHKIMAVLTQPALRAELNRHSQQEIRPMTWEAAAEKCLQLYDGLCGPQFRRRTEWDSSSSVGNADPVTALLN